MTKDRLLEFQTILIENDHQEDFNFDDVTIALNKPDELGEFFIEVQEIQNLLQEILTAIHSIKLIHEEIISAPFLNEKDKVKKQLDELMHQTKEMAANCHTRLNLIEPPKNQVDYSLQGRIQKTHHFTLTKQFIEMMTSYNESQMEYREDCKEKLKRQLEITGRCLDEDEFEDMMKHENVAVFTQEIILEPQWQTLTDIHSRHADIIQLENSIKELNELFIDMTHFVHHQEAILDRIDKQVYLTSTKIQNGTFPISSVTRKKLRKKFKRGLLVLIIGAIIISMAGFLIF